MSLGKTKEDPAGSIEASEVGAMVEVIVGNIEGISLKETVVGDSEDWIVGFEDGALITIGEPIGLNVGTAEGTSLGKSLSRAMVGALVVAIVGSSEGASLAKAAGNVLGVSAGITV